MYLSKKAIATYIIVICITSTIFSLFFLVILESLYSQENIICEEIDYVVEDICIFRNGLRLKVTNLAISNLEFLINKDNRQELISKESKIFNFKTTDETKVEFSPIITLGDNIVFCKSKKVIIDAKLINKNCN